MTRSNRYLVASLAACGAVLAAAVAPQAQMDLGPKVEKTYGQGLPRDRDKLIFTDDQYPVWPLTPEQKAYAPINGARMKQHVVNLAKIAIRYRDAGHKWWGRLPGTTADKEGMAYMTKEFESLGLKVEHHPFTLPDDWRPTDFSGSYKTADGKTVELTTIFPVSDTKPTGPQGITAEAVWVGIGSGADFIGRDVKGKAVVIYSTFVPGGRSHSASDRARIFDSNTRAAKLGAAAIIDVMAVPGNGQFEP
ncbi:MAG TPA: hypothetical protein VKC35_17000, partial [Vicinamibacterales bacterium]|nr:hypothetical protein [Vicinamibacterales bacterium]